MKRSVTIWLINELFKPGWMVPAYWSNTFHHRWASFCFFFDQPKECKMKRVEWNGPCLYMNQTCVPRCLNRVFKLLQHFHPRNWVGDIGSRCPDYLTSKQRCQGLLSIGRSTTVHIRVFFTLKLCMNYITQTSRMVVTCADRNEKIAYCVEGRSQKKKYDWGNLHEKIVTEVLNVHENVSLRQCPWKSYGGSNVHG